jgi:hypothetical protein
MRIFPISICVVLLALCLSNVSCCHKPISVSTSEPELPWSGFGEPAVGKISVLVGGDVKHPGHYYLDADATLESIFYSFGGWGEHGEFSIPPKDARLTRQIGGLRVDTFYPIRTMTKQERESVLLKDKDVLLYPTIIF